MAELAIRYTTKPSFRTPHSALRTGMLQRLADSVILCPSTEAIPVEHKAQRELRYGERRLDCWVESVGCESTDEARAFVLKFGGAGSRAERQTTHPLDFWDDLAAEVWAVNWPGFGASSGPASVRNLAGTGAYIYEQIRRTAAGRPVVVTGNSLGAAVALHVAARFRDMAGVILRNPPPLRQLIVGRHGWYSAWIGAWLIARQVPVELDSLQNARGSDVPAVFVTCGSDRTVPPVYQDAVFDFYAGPKQRLVLPEADHVDLPTSEEQEAYRVHLEWLRRRAGIDTPRER